MPESELRCENCGQRLDPTDKFCRECGLPTLRRAEAQKQVPTLPPDTGELKRALDAMPEPRPFVREEPAAPSPPVPDDEPAGDLTTSGVVRVTNPTFVAKLASSTALMVGVMLVLALTGILLLVLAFQR